MRHILWFFLLLMTTPLVATAPQTIAPGLEAREITKGVHVITHSISVAPANSMVVELGPNDILLVDSPWVPSATLLLLDWIEKKFGKRQITAINTHFHNDRIAGNALLRSRKIPVYGSDKTVELIRSRGEKDRAGFLKLVKEQPLQDEIKTMAIAEPDHVFPLKEGRKLTLGSRPVEIFYPGPGHTVDNVVVYLPDLELLFGGCFIVGFPKLGNIADADMKAWPESVKKLSRFKLSRVVPGHGLDFSKGLVEHTAALVTPK